LRERVARLQSRSGITFIGPVEDAVWPADSLEEAWQLEKLYGRRPRWILYLMSVGTFRPRPGDSGVNFHVEEVGGIPVEVCSAVPIPRLSIELHGGAIRVCEIDA